MVDKPTVVVPIFNAAEEVRACLNSLLLCSANDCRIILVDDASTDPRIADILEGFKDCIALVTHRRNVGYLSSVNEAIQHTTGDVILLNSDTVVTPNWVKKLKACAYSRDNVAMVNPWTNNGSQFSLPFREGSDIEGYADTVERVSLRKYPEMVTCYGWCVYLRRGALNSIGLFDEQHFGRGYGEEADYAMRGRAKGYVCLLADDTFVYHKGSASFGTAQTETIKQHHEILGRLHPEFWDLLAEFEKADPLRPLRQRIEAACPREQWVVHLPSLHPRRVLGNLAVRLARPVVKAVMAESEVAQPDFMHMIAWEPRIFDDSQRLHLGERVSLLDAAINTNSGHIWIGDDTFCGHGVKIIAGTHDYRLTRERRFRDFPREGRDIRIGRGVWLATGAIVLGPCSIGDNAVVGAGAVVVPGSEIPAGVIVTGIPAKVVKTL